MTGVNAARRHRRYSDAVSVLLAEPAGNGRFRHCARRRPLPSGTTTAVVSAVARGSARQPEHVPDRSPDRPEPVLQ